MVGSPSARPGAALRSRLAHGPSPGSRNRLLVRGLALTALFAISCSSTGGGGCGGGGCGGCGSGTYRYPLNDPNRPDAVTQREGARARITQSFIDFIQPQLPGLIRSALGSQGGFTIDANNVLHVPIPDQNDIIDIDVLGIGLVNVDIRQGEALIYLDDLRTCPTTGTRSRCMWLEFIDTPMAEMGVRLALYEMRLGVRLKIQAEILGSDASCPVFGDAAPGDVAAEFTVSTLIQPGVGPDPDRNLDLDVSVSDVELVDLAIDVAGSSVYCAESQCQDCALREPFGGNCLDPGGECNECGLLCGGVLNAVASLANALIDVVRPLLNRVLGPIIQNFINSALADFNNQPAKLEMQLGLADLLPIAAFRNANPFGIFMAPEVGKFPVVQRMGEKGMEITVTGGAEAELADCIGALDPFFEPKGPPPILGGRDDRGRPYHVGFTMAQAVVNQILYAVHRSGSLCLKLSSQDIKELTNGAFSLNASVLSLLASDLTKVATDTAPVIIELKPREPAVLNLGSGTRTGTDAMGNPTYDWLLQLSVQDLGIAFHVLSHDRYVRIFEVLSDINVGLNVNILPDNKLEVAVGELRIDDFEETFNELLPNADFAMVLPTLIDLALQTLLTNQLNFDLDISNTLSDALGGAPIYMRINEIKRDGPSEDYLTLTITFSDQPGGGNLTRAAETFARVADDPGLIERIDGVARPTGRVRLMVGEGRLSEALEYQARVDGGLWRAARPAQQDGTLWVDDPRLVITGRHQLEVRGRYPDDYTSLDPTPARLEVEVDTLRPVVLGELVHDRVEVVVTDQGSRPEQLRLEGRYDGGPWFEVALAPEAERAVGHVPLAGILAHRLELVATDALGNHSRPERVVVGAEQGLTAGAEARAAGCACDARRNAPSQGAGAASLVLLLFALLRRRA